MGRRAERETRKQSPHVPAMGSRAFGLLAPSLQWPGPTHPTPASCEVEGEVWSAPWRWYSATTECFSSVQFSSVQFSRSVVSDSASAYKQENRKATGKPPPRRITAKWPIRLLLGTETGWCRQKLGGTKSVVTGSNLKSSLSLFVIKLLAGNCC